MKDQYTAEELAKMLWEDERGQSFDFWVQSFRKAMEQERKRCIEIIDKEHSRFSDKTKPGIYSDGVKDGFCRAIEAIIELTEETDEQP